eukprot:TRINITY_DN16019_c0_g1_i1.p1 TRINITY_DN16019_c0_g1~~TRINITY_DN16019_c0_g1_i1.p1  ORF type:complete len:361 (-),score=47.48 TRINITY_DN16019_c0_g1_i1:99-1181(-)
MGNICNAKASNDEEELKSREIEKGLHDHRRKHEAEVKILMLGTGESGKSTIAKQLKIIYLCGYSDNERLSFRRVIHANIIHAVKEISQTFQNLGLVNTLPTELQNTTNLFLSNQIHKHQSLNPELTNSIKELWENHLVQNHYFNNSEFHTDDSHIYYLNSITRISSDNYVPTDQDLLRARMRTLGVNEICFENEGTRFKIVDVGGQRSQRRKWIPCFDGITALIFCVAMSEYDQFLHEDRTVNRMHESLAAFRDVATLPYFVNTPMILFLNKCDLFEEKIIKKDLKECFPDYDGGCNVENGSRFLKELFRSQDSKRPRNLLYIHITCATNTDNINYVFADVKNFVINVSLERSGLLLETM